MDQGPEYKTRNNKLCRENIVTKLMDLGFREDIMRVTKKTWGIKAKINERDYIKLISFCITKETIHMGE